MPTNNMIKSKSP